MIMGMVDFWCISVEFGRLGLLSADHIGIHGCILSKDH